MNSNIKIKTLNIHTGKLGVTGVGKPTPYILNE